MNTLKQFLLTLIAGMVVAAGSAFAVQYTVLYLDLAQTITAQHTFNPSTSSTAPFIVGSNAAEVEVADLHAEVGTRFPSNPSNCGTGTYPAGIDATGAVESCSSATPTDTDYIPWPADGRVAYCTCPGSASMNCVGDTETNTGTCTTTSAASDTQPIMHVCTTSTANAEFGFNGTAIYRADPFDITFQAAVGMEQTSSAKRVWIGLTDETTANQLNSDTPAADFAAFRYSTVAGDTDWQCVTGDGVSVHVSPSGQTINTTTRTFEIEIDKNGGDVRFYIDNNLVCTHQSTDNLPGSLGHTNMRAISRGKNLTAGATATGIRNGYIFIRSDK